jgi:hypothetical protein
MTVLVHRTASLRIRTDSVYPLRTDIVDDKVRSSQARAVRRRMPSLAGRWEEWYQVNIPVAEDRYERWLAGEYDEEV